MKKILCIALITLSFGAIAQHSRDSGVSRFTDRLSSESVANAISAGGSGGSGGNSTATGGSSNATGNTSGNVTVGCLINCSDQTNAAAIGAQAARDVAATTQVIKNTPSVSGPALTTSNDTCMGSTSASVNIAGLGIGGGSSWVDTNCKMLKNSRELWNMGMKGAALAILCTDPVNKDALEISGYECPQTVRARKETEKQSAEKQSSEYTDPIIRARLGLAPLSSK